MTYWGLNTLFLLPAVMVFFAAARRARRRGRKHGSAEQPLRTRAAAIGLTAAVLLILTAVFDNIMIALGLFSYSPDLISGAFLGLAPLEDFAYAIAAVVLLPSLWTLLERPRTEESSA